MGFSMSCHSFGDMTKHSPVALNRPLQDHGAPAVLPSGWWRKKVPSSGWDHEPGCHFEVDWGYLGRLTEQHLRLIICASFFPIWTRMNEVVVWSWSIDCCMPTTNACDGGVCRIVSAWKWDSINSSKSSLSLDLCRFPSNVQPCKCHPNKHQVWSKKCLPNDVKKHKQSLRFEAIGMSWSPFPNPK